MDPAATPSSSIGRARYYQDLFHSVPDPVLLLDPTGMIEEANRAAEHLLGGPAARLRSRSFQSFLVPAARRRFSCYLAEVARGTHAGRGWHGALHAAKHPPIGVTITAGQLRGPAGTVIGICCALRRAPVPHL